MAGANAQIKHRLDQLDDFEEGSVQEMQDMSLQEWMKKWDAAKCAPGLMAAQG